MFHKEKLFTEIFPVITCHVCFAKKKNEYDNFGNAMKI